MSKTFDELIQLSTSSPRILVEVDLGILNIQWINCGCGIWKVNFDNDYPEVSIDLLDGFTTQSFSNIGSVRVNSSFLNKVTSLSILSTETESFYYESSTKTLYINMPNYDEPYIHTIWLGVINGFSKEEFTPVGSTQIYEGRLLNIPSFGYSRDPLYFGKMSYPSISIQIINTDGKFDTFADTNDLFGNSVRILYGFEELDYSEYKVFYSGCVEKISIDDNYLNINIIDSRKQLSDSVAYYCDGKNALDAIFDLLKLKYNTLTYSDSFFNTTEWNTAKALVPNVTIIVLDDAPEPIISIIEKICASVFGMFIIQPDWKFSFKMIDNSATALTTIKRFDIKNESIQIDYDPNEVLSSIRASFDVIYDETTNQYKTWISNTDYEDEVYNKYKIILSKDFDTYLIDQTSAEAFIQKVMLYVKDIHGETTLTIPMKYYLEQFGGVVNVELNRENSIMIGTKKCEILGKKYDLENNSIILNLRIA